ncbi:MAG: alpha/beta hydrolase [Flavobacteriales bacterium]
MIIKTQKTAYVKTIGDLNAETESILLVAHGYGQLVDFFARHLENIKHPKLCILCPEALNRFYLCGYRGRVGAHWMSKYRREEDIEDNHFYLNQVFEQAKAIAPNADWHLLGFSQGAQTLSRWLCQENIEAKSLTLWGGRQSYDIDWERFRAFSEQQAVEFRIGDEDEYYDPEKIETWLNELRENKLRFRYQSYKGLHRLERQALIDFAQQVLKLNY